MAIEKIQKVSIYIREPILFKNYENGKEKIVNKKIKIEKNVPDEMNLNNKKKILSWVKSQGTDGSKSRNVTKVKIRKPEYIIRDENPRINYKVEIIYSELIAKKRITLYSNNNVPSKEKWKLNNKKTTITVQADDLKGMLKKIKSEFGDSLNKVKIKSKRQIKNLNKRT